MRNDIFEMRKDPARKAEADKLLAGRSAAAPATLAPGQWHTLRIAITGDTMRVALDSAPVASLQSPGIAHATKTDFHFTVSGKDALFDDAARPARRSKPKCRLASRLSGPATWSPTSCPKSASACM